MIDIHSNTDADSAFDPGDLGGFADPTLPGRSLEAQFEAIWQRFNGLARTVDTLISPSARWRRLLTPVNVSLIVPIQDEAATAYLMEAQRQLNLYMAYDPQPVEKLHITLVLFGFLRAALPLPGTLTMSELRQLAGSLEKVFARLPSFTVRVGPINAFPNVAIAEVHDDGQLRWLEKAAVELIPKSRRNAAPYPLIPHITLGYFGSRPTRPIIRVLTQLREMPALDLRIDQTALTLYYRGFGPYRAKYALRHSVEEVVDIIPLKSNVNNSSSAKDETKS